jgi:hypothetical protein
MQFASEPCPKCAKPYAVGAEVCPSCGVIFAKLRRVSDEVKGTDQLELTWQNLVHDWINGATHEQFLQLCVQHKNLPFASMKYKRLLEADPHNEKALEMQKKAQQVVINELLTESIGTKVEESGKKGIYVLVFLFVVLAFMMFQAPKSMFGTGLPIGVILIAAYFLIQFLKRKFLS